MIATFFRWRLKPGAEAAFRQGWAEATRRYLSRGSHGSSLWRDEDGCFCAFALWPDEPTRRAAFTDPQGQAHLTSLAPLVEETVERVDLHPLENFWRLPENTNNR